MKRLHVKKKNIFDTIILLLIFSQLFILGFWGLENILNKVIAILIVLRLGIECRKIPKIAVIYGIIIVIFFVGNLLSGSINGSFWKDNSLIMLYPLVYTVYFYFLYMTKENFLDRFFINNRILFNIILWINLFVMIVQLKIPYSIQAFHTGAGSSMYEDTVSGLFRYGATHAVAIYFIFVLVYNISFIKNKNIRCNKKSIILQIIVQLILMLYISLNNDNKCFFLLLPVAILILFLQYQSPRSPKMVVAESVCLIGVDLIVIGYLFVPVFHQFMGNIFSFVYDEIINPFCLGTLNKYVAGSRERFAIVGYALNQKSTFSLGLGLGSMYMYQSEFGSYRHLGQSDLGVFLLLLGIWLTLLYVGFYLYMYLKIINGSKKVCKNPIFNIGLIGFVLIVALYTQSFTRTYITTCTIMLMIAYRLNFRYRQD